LSREGLRGLLATFKEEEDSFTRETLSATFLPVRMDGRLRVEWLNGVPRRQKMLKGHLTRVKHHLVYQYTRNTEEEVSRTRESLGATFPQVCTYRAVGFGFWVWGKGLGI
jgi:hypothetical protein